MKPVVALVGRPNVGKSTLFNRLTRSREALVSDQPGVTRDRIYGEARFGGRGVILVDTGGLDRAAGAEGVEGLASQQSWQAVEEADAVVFLVDGRSGLHPEDQELADALRAREVPVLLAVNKSEGQPVGAAGEFYALGLGEPHAVSAEHNEGVKELGKAVAGELPPAAEEEDEALPGVRIALVGRPNVGKSTLVNALLGEQRVITYDQPGTTRDAVHTVLERDGHTYTLVDTAGVRRRARVKESLEKFSAIKAIQAMEAAEVVFLLIDASEGVTDQDARLAHLVTEAGRGVVIVVNKWDGLEPRQRDAVRRGLDLKLMSLGFAPVLFVSALHGTNVGHLLETADRIHTAFTQELTTNAINRVLQDAITAHPPPVRKGFRTKIRYGHQGGQRPPTIVIHGNRTEFLPKNYRKYLTNQFRRAFDLEGVPLRLELRTQENPYEGKPRGRRPRKDAKKAPGKRR